MPRPRKAPAKTRPRSDLWICLLLLAAVFCVYAQSRHFAFVNYDDPDYVTGNAHVRQGITPDGIAWAFTSIDDANWFPLTRLSQMLDVQLFGMDSGAHHLVSVLVHAAASVLLFLFLAGATGVRGPSAFVALIFALHPLHVESVAWVAERKDVLCAFFWFAALWAYVRDVRWLVIAAFVAGLMSKPMIVTLPFTLLLVDVWPLKRGLRMREKLPLFALAAAGAIVTYVVQKAGGAVKPSAVFGLGNALVSYVVYIGKTFWPTGLAAFYPYPVKLALWQVTLAAVTLAGSGSPPPALPVPGRRLVLVPGHSRSGDWNRARGRPGKSRPVHVRAHGRPRHDGCVEWGGTGAKMAPSSPGLGNSCVRRVRRCGVGAGQLLAEQRDAVRPRTGGHQRKLRRRGEPGFLSDRPARTAGGSPAASRAGRAAPAGIGPSALRSWHRPGRDAWAVR
jgi:hypothetical protein